MTPTALRLYGRGGSHYTRVARMISHEARVEIGFAPVSLLSTGPEAYAGHPALKPSPSSDRRRTTVRAGEHLPPPRAPFSTQFGRRMAGDWDRVWWET